VQVVIKRRGNAIYIACLVTKQGQSTQRMYWIVGYTEELLSHTLKQPVKLELQTIGSDKDLIFKYI
jgi:hypothetical protein